MLAMAFSKWLCTSDSQFRLVPVGSDWTNREPLLGYPNALQPGNYVKPDSGVLDLLLSAATDRDTPYFLMLDEMNLSHVERYFADFLSAMESKEPIPLHSIRDGMTAADGTIIPHQIYIPDNFFIIGTVNIDETTYMFSPKVLDRASVIEFRVSGDNMKQFLDNPRKADLSTIVGLGAAMQVDFLQKKRQHDAEFENWADINTTLYKFFGALNNAGAEFGYRTAAEIFCYASKVRLLESSDQHNRWSVNEIIDTAIAQKLLPKLHGSRKKLVPVLQKLSDFCLTNPVALDSVDKEGDPQKANIKFPISYDKIRRMYTRAIHEGFTSFAEA
jgi:5-methylcytosine-specific restriction endonuclease McrBC GTP-binding regulatory subunit McrB